MNTSEIRALLEQLKEHHHAYLRLGNFSGTALALDRVIEAIETLLAREAELDKAIKNARIRNRDDNVDKALYNLHDEIRAILNPEGE